MPQEQGLLEPERRGSLTVRAVALLSVLALLVLTLAVPIRSWFAQRAEIADLQASVQKAEGQVAAMEVLRQRWEDPAFIAAEARRRLHFVLPGEIGYTVIGIEQQAGEQATEQTQGPAGPWYAALWSATRQADKSAP